MHPLLFEIGDFKIYTYGPIMALGFLLAFLLIYHIAKLRGEDTNFYMDLYIWIIIFGVLGAELLYNALEWRAFIKDPVRMLNPRNGGLVWYGGVVAAGAFTLWYSRRKGKPILQVTDTLAAPLSLGLGVGRWGCLMGGCCYGKPSDLPWGICYPEVHETGGLPVHPAPIYSSIASFVIAGIIYFALRKGVRRGVPTLVYFTLYPLFRFMVEFVRGDELRGFIYKGELMSVSTSQFISLVILAVAAVIWIRFARSAKNKGGG